MDDKMIKSVIQKIKEITNNSLNVQLNMKKMENGLPDLKRNDINDVLLYLEQNNLINVINKIPFLGKKYIKIFKINSKFIDTYPIP